MNKVRKSRKKSTSEPAGPKIFVAVVIRASALVMVANTGANVNSLRPQGDWACFLDTDRNHAIDKAMKSCAIWAKSGNSGYDILVGELTQAVTPHFTVEKLKL